MVKNWNRANQAHLEINSRAESGIRACRQGLVRDPDGRLELVVWLQWEATAPMLVTLRGAKPGPASAGSGP